jgi:acyl-CoA thioesterase FadM
MANLPEQFTLPIEVASYDVGPDNRLRLSGVLRYQQEAAERHLLPMGMGWNALLDKGMAFVSSRWHARVIRLPEMGERVTLTTWHRERKGARFLRCYEWRDERGELLLCGVMQFALVSTVDHRLLRGDEFDPEGRLPSCAARVACDDPARYVLPALQVARTYTVGWSDTDRNRHMNNTRYADLACDALADKLEGRRVVDVQMHFAGETLLDDEVSLAVGAADAVYVQGSTERGVAFTLRMELENDHGI